MTAQARTAKRSEKPPQTQLNDFMAKYLPEIAAETKSALAKMRKLVPGALELVYDNYNALVIGFGPTERASDAVLSIAVYPRWLTLFFLQDAVTLPDPDGLLGGSGKIVRQVRLQSAADLDKPAVKSLIKVALERAEVPIDKDNRRKLIIKSISAKQQPRRPAK